MPNRKDRRKTSVFRISALEHKNVILSRSQPCDRPSSCDRSCGRDHHCGTPTIKGRRRSRSSARASDNDDPPTISNLANSAGVPVERMNQLVNNQAQANSGALTPAQVPTRIPPRPKIQTKGVEICRNYHYYKVCIHGTNCKFAHELFPANAMPTLNHQASGGARALSNAIGGIQRQQNSQTKPRSRSTSHDQRRYVKPVYNPEHPDYWAMTNNANLAEGQASNSGNMAGNASEQGRGTGAAQTQESQIPVYKPQLVQRPRAASTSAASEVIQARREVQQTMTQQASTQARMKAMKDKAWKESLDSVLDMISNTYTTSVHERNGSSAETPEPSPGQE